MNKIIWVFLCCSSALIAQDITYHESEVMTLPKSISNSSSDLKVEAISVKPESQHGAALDSYKRSIFRNRNREIKYNKTTSYSPSIDTGYVGHQQGGIPNDNNIAVSNTGVVVSVSNSSISVYDSAGNVLLVKTLFGLAWQQINLNRPYDPHVLYDPDEDRFVLVFLDGTSSGYTKMIVAFTKTSDPAGDWHFYELPGNVHGDNTWSDYPFPALSKDELFISVLLWKNGESGWDTEATNELIWQIDKNKGYQGDSLVYKYYDSIRVNGRQVWNTRPIQGGAGLYGPNMYLLANRAVDVSNDSIFLFEITNTLASGQAQFKSTILKTNQPYGIPPSALQPDSTNVLRTNYADIQSGYFENNRITWVGNSNDPVKNVPGIYLGKIEDPGGTPTATGHIFSSDTLDLNYPSIAYAGNSQWDHSSLINCLHSSTNTYPGTSCVFEDGSGVFSDLVRLKPGDSTINRMGGNIERWGDYTGAQRRYNKPGEVWVIGSFGRANKTPGNWIGQIGNSNPSLSKSHLTLGHSFELYPNPSDAYIQLVVEVKKDQSYKIQVYNMLGQLIESQKVFLRSGSSKVRLNTSSFKTGTYMLRLQDGESIMEEKKVVIQH